MLAVPWNAQGGCTVEVGDARPARLGLHDLQTALLTHSFLILRIRLLEIGQILVSYELANISAPVHSSLFTCYLAYLLEYCLNILPLSPFNLRKRWPSGIQIMSSVLP